LIAFVSVVFLWGAKGYIVMTLENCEVMAFLATTRADKARAFYCDVLGLGFEEDNPFALVVRTANAIVRIQKVAGFMPVPFTALGWKVGDVRGTAKQLLGKGVKFERFDGMGQDDLGIWFSPGGAMVCWFKDPDGNLLSLTQFN
jgi:catechol 2,3-dioxygenase-like lactoylglutathione lyase family enzyme